MTTGSPASDLGFLEIMDCIVARAIWQSSFLNTTRLYAECRSPGTCLLPAGKLLPLDRISLKSWVTNRHRCAFRQALQNGDVRPEVFRFLSRFELDTVQQCSRRWCDFVDATANAMALYRIQFTLNMVRFTVIGNNTVPGFGLTISKFLPKRKDACGLFFTAQTLAFRRSLFVSPFSFLILR